MHVQLRIARPEDSLMVWSWRNEKAARSASGDTHEIPLSAHEEWFLRAIADPDARIYMISINDKEVVGYVRFRRLAQQAAEISVSLDPQIRGRGIGSEAIRRATANLVREKWASSVVALVRKENARSLAAFKSADFRLVGETGAGFVKLSYAGPQSPTAS